jgi:hypothetical protein
MFKGSYSMKIWVEMNSNPDSTIEVEPVDVSDPNAPKEEIKEEVIE